MKHKATKQIFTTLFIVLTIMIAPKEVWSKDLTHRLGVGPKNPFSFELPSLGVNYYMEKDLGIVGAIGIDTTSANSKFGLMGGVRRIIFEETMLNFYYGGNFSLVSNEVASVTHSGFELTGLGGAEFFFQGLENLGFQLEAGLQIVSLSNGGTRFRTFADTPMRAGIIFYF